MKNRDLSSPIEYEVIYKDKIVPVRDKPKKYREPQYRPPKKTYKGGFITMTIIAFLVFVMGVGALGYLIIAKPEAIFPAANPTFSVVWRNNTGDNIEDLQTDPNVKKGTTVLPEYRGPKPHRDDDASYSYVFNDKWTIKGSLPVSSNIEMMADYTKVPKDPSDLLVTWNGYDEKGNIKLLRQDHVKTGDIAEWKGDEDPTRPANSEYTYEFTGWKPAEGRNIIEDTIFTAQFREIKIPDPVVKYRVEWKKYGSDGVNLETFDDFEVDANTRPSMPSDPKPERIDPKGHYIYKFDKWDPDVTKPVTGNTTYTPTYTYEEVIPEPEPNIYHVKWLQYNDDGKLEEFDEDDVKEGEKARSIAGPFRKADKAYTYEFDKWLPDDKQKIMEDTTFVPLYNKTEIKPDTKIYTVEWKRYKADGNFETFKTANVEEGKTAEKVEGPTKASDGAFTYVFKNWSPDDSKPITRDTTFIPEYTQTAIPPAPNKYMVVWKNLDADGGQIWKAEQLEDGKIPTKPAKDPYKISEPGYRYEFTGWNPSAPTAIHGNTEYIAQYTKVTDSNVYAWNGQSYSLTKMKDIDSVSELYTDNTHVPERVTTFGDGKNLVSSTSEGRKLTIPPMIENIASKSVYMYKRGTILLPKSVKTINYVSIEFEPPYAFNTSTFFIECEAPSRPSGWESIFLELNKVFSWKSERVIGGGVYTYEFDVRWNKT